MKKLYNAPKAEKVDFNYEENVLASSTGSPNAVKCPDPCSSGSGHSGGNNGGHHSGNSGYHHPFIPFFCW